MVRQWHRFALVTTTLAAAVLNACKIVRASLPSDGPIVVRDAWARTADSGATGGVYLTLVNGDTMEVRIASLVTSAARSATIHETLQHEGVVHMMAHPSLALPRDSTIVMAPGGLHVMLTNLTQALHAGDTLRLTLTLDDGRTVPIAAAVRAP